MRFLNSVTVPKNVKVGTLWDFLTFIVLQNIAKNKTKWRPFGAIQKIRVKNTKGGSLVCFRGSGRRCFCFGRGSGVSSMFWTSVVQVDDVEQMNKKVDRSR